MNWHVFKRDDPDTWPELDCPMLVCWTNGNDYRLYNVKWDNEDRQFVRDLRWIVFQKGDVFYTYIGYIPYIERELHPMKCMQENTRCEYDDDGYCLCETECQHKREATEYCLGYKRIWKEF